MKKALFINTLFITLSVAKLFGQTTAVTVDVNDVVNSNNKLIILTGAGQSFFTGHQAGPYYAFPDGIFRAITDNSNGVQNFYFDGITSGLRNFSVRADGQGYFAGNVGIGTAAPVTNLDIHKAYTGSGLYEASTIGLSTDNAATSWSLGSISGYVAAGPNNSIGGYPGGLLFKTKNIDGDQNSIPTTKMVIDANGNVGINTNMPDSKLAVNGTIHSKEVKVNLNVPAPDYVFEKAYELKSLSDIQRYIDQNKHLPDVPSASELAKDGLKVGEMNMLLLKKVEELTLYLIDKDKQVTDQQKQIITQQTDIDLLKQQLNKLIKEIHKN